MPTNAVTFYYDLGSPYAYLTADRIDEQVDTSIDVEWMPVLLGGIFRATGRSSWAETAKRGDGIAEIAQRAAAYGIPELHYPEPWPNNGLTAMRVATWAQSAGAGRRFARAAFEVQFADGLPLSEAENIELAAHRAGLDHQFALESASDPAVKQALIDNTQAAIDVGVVGVPSFKVGDEVFWGDDRLVEAVAAASA
ncbi:MAG: 2-hydroxychromene-2-carboxylate isomerase [Solirubrobacterales bacterium]